MHMPNSLNPHKRIHGLSFLAVCFIYADASLKNIIHKSQHELSFLAGCYICMCFCLFFSLRVVSIDSPSRWVVGPCSSWRVVLLACAVRRTLPRSSPDWKGNQHTQSILSLITNV